MAQAKPAPPPAVEPNVETYHRVTRMLDRLHRRYLDVLRFELVRLKVHDINPTQLLMLMDIPEGGASVRDITNRGYYIGARANYNIKQLVACGYAAQERSPHDKRAISIRLTDKGQSITERIREQQDHAATALVMTRAAHENLDLAFHFLVDLERAWADYLHYNSL